MAGMNYVCLYISYLESLAPFSDAEIGRMVRAMLIYTATGETPLFDGNERFIWPTIKAQIDRDEAAYQERCEKNRANGAKGGRPKNQSVITETEWFSEKPKKAKEKEKEKEKEKDKEKKKENDSDMADKPPTRHSFSPPSVDDVREYCTENGYNVDPERFVDHYTSNGWMVGRNRMKDWKSAVRNWNRKDEKERLSTQMPDYGGELNCSL